MNTTQLEREEIKVLADEGFSFEITYKEPFKQKIKRFGFIPATKIEMQEVTETLRIEPLRLSTMDRIAKYQIELYFDEEKINGEDDHFEEVNSIVAKNIYPLSSVVAIAVLGTDYSFSKFESMRKKLLDALTPKQLFQLSVQILALSDHANFINSTRLMIARNVIKPNEVE